MRKIIHLDMDCFYAAVEMREKPELAELPIAVGGGSRRGVVCTCNYVARKFGVRSAMPGFMARQKCPNIVFLPVRFDLYRAESVKIRVIMAEYSPLVEPLSLDEAFLDVSHGTRYAWDIAKEIRRRIFETTKLTASAGIAPNKMLAKIASDWRKPNGQFAITPDKIDAFMKDLPLRKIWGIGPKSAEKFEQRGMKTCGDLQKLTLAEMNQHHGKWGAELYRLCRGEDNRTVQPNRARKSLSSETTFSDFLLTLETCAQGLDPLIAEVLDYVEKKYESRNVRKAFVKVKFSDFTHTTRECISAQPTRETFLKLLSEARERKNLPVRLLGAGVRFVDEEEEELEAPQQSVNSSSNTDLEQGVLSLLTTQSCLPKRA